MMKSISYMIKKYQYSCQSMDVWQSRGLEISAPPGVRHRACMTFTYHTQKGVEAEDTHKKDSPD